MVLSEEARVPRDTAPRRLGLASASHKVKARFGYESSHPKAAVSAKAYRSAYPLGHIAEGRKGVRLIIVTLILNISISLEYLLLIGDRLLSS